MSERPTLHVTNWSSRRLHGPGRLITIMALPREFEQGVGYIDGLVPHMATMQAAKRERDAGVADGPAMRTYRDHYAAKMGAFEHYAGPGSLHITARWGSDFAGAQVIVRDGDSLLCSCSVDHARQGLCHRVWAAPYLVRAGWRVLLDGKEVVL